MKLVLRTGDLRNEVCILIYGLLPRKDDAGKATFWLGDTSSDVLFSTVILVFGGVFVQCFLVIRNILTLLFYLCFAGLTCDMVKVNYIGRISLK